MRNNSKFMALGGVFAALALVLMNLGGLIPAVTYLCPMLCMLMLAFIHAACGSRTAWAWYGAVALLSLLMSPNKEAAAVFACLGYYPILKPWMDRRKIPWLWKALLFNVTMVSLYAVLMNVMGVTEIEEEFAQLGQILLWVLLAMGNATFFMIDLVLTRFRLRRR